MYRSGIGGVLLNKDESTKWLKMSADQGFSKAQEEYAIMFPPTEKDVVEIVSQEVSPPVVTTPVVTTPVVTTTRERTPDINRSYYQPPKSGPKGGVFLMVFGGLTFAGSLATAFMLPLEKTISWDSSNTTGKYKVIEEKNAQLLNYCYIGSAVGGVFIITGVTLKILQSNNQKKAKYDNYSLQPSPQHDNTMRLNLVATGTGAGIQLTF
jgi:TPR repeat protein